MQRKTAQSIQPRSILSRKKNNYLILTGLVVQHKIVKNMCDSCHGGGGRRAHGCMGDGGHADEEGVRSSPSFWSSSNGHTTIKKKHFKWTCIASKNVHLTIKKDVAHQE